MYGIRNPRSFGTVRPSKPLDSLATVGASPDEENYGSTRRSLIDGLVAPSRTISESSHRTETQDELTTKKNERTLTKG